MEKRPGFGGPGIPWDICKVAPSGLYKSIGLSILDLADVANVRGLIGFGQGRIEQTEMN